ncbi:MAG: hypothetical protein KGL39_31365 [Patescibacteria group bacterium]|nr:hypothetical protein [Patescibacteria group bacterium]
MGKGSNTTTTTNGTTWSPTPQAADAYNALLSRAQGVASTPYQAYTGELVAPFNAQQNLGVANINANANFAQPYIQQAAGLASSAANPITAQQIAAYQNPYTQSVVNATQQQFNLQNAQQAQGVNSNAIAQGAYGGNRVGVAQANLANAQQTAQAPVIAGLYSNSYQQGVNTALAEQQAQAQGAYSLGNLGVAGQNAALTGASAQFGAGTAQQQTQQAQDTAAYNQYLQALGFPYQQTQWLAGLETGVGSQLGGTQTGTSSTTQPAPNPWGQALGVGTTLLGFLKNGGRVRGYDAGGGVAPYSGAQGWIPSIGISPGRSASPMGAGGGGAGGASAGVAPDYVKMAQQGFNFGSALSDKFGSLGVSPPFDITAGTGAFFKDGGGVRGYDGGGGVAPFAPDFNYAFNSFEPDDAAPVFDAEFAGVGNNALPQAAAPSIAPSSGFAPNAGVAPLPTNANDYELGAVGYSPSASAPLDFDSTGFGGQPSAAVTGVAPMPITQSSDISTPTAGYAENVGHMVGIIGNMETGGVKDPYAYQGAVTYDKNGVGHRPIGRYGIMDFNVGPWTSEVLGKPMTVDQFASDPQAQDMVARAKFGQYVNKYGPEGAARAWLGGESGMWNGSAHDVLGTTVDAYGNKFMTALNGRSGVAPPAADGAALPPNAQAAQYTPNGVAPTASSARGAFDLPTITGGNGLLGLNPQMRMALVRAGLGMLASRSPFLGNQIGEGGVAGLETYQQYPFLGQKYEAGQLANQGAVLRNRLTELGLQGQMALRGLYGAPGSATRPSAVPVASVGNAATSGVPAASAPLPAEGAQTAGPSRVLSPAFQAQVRGVTDVANTPQGPVAMQNGQPLFNIPEAYRESQMLTVYGNPAQAAAGAKMMSMLETMMKAGAQYTSTGAVAPIAGAQETAARGAAMTAAAKAPYEILSSAAREGARPVTVGPNQAVTTGANVNPAIQSAVNWALGSLPGSAAAVLPQPAAPAASAPTVPVPQAAPAAPVGGGAPAPTPGAWTPHLIRNPDGSLSSSVTPGSEAIQREVAENYKQAGQTARASQQTQFRLGLIEHDLNNLNEKPGYYNSGTTANSRLELARTVNSVATSMGVTPPFDQNKVATWEDLNKESIQLGFALSRTLGSREAMQVVQQAIHANPSIQNTPQGARLVIGSIRSASQADTDYYNFLTNYASRHNGDLVGADTAFYQQNPGQAYAHAAIALGTAPNYVAKLRQNPDANARAWFDHHFGAGASSVVLRMTP